MKILAIRGKNLASLEDEFEIDFQKEPLLSSGIYAITGSTGAGKSTILDAICLALFCKTPRFQNISEIEMVKDVGENKINQTDIRNILRRGAGFGYAEVDFLSLSNERYRSRWGVRRGRDNAKSALQKYSFSLINLDTKYQEQGRNTELISKVSELIGLSFDQFKRAVMLAQGDFSTFLKSKNNEKAELLEKLTGTEIYSIISKKIYENYKCAENDINLINERLKSINILEKDDYEALKISKSELENKIKVIENELNIIKEKKTWIEENQIREERMRQAIAENEIAEKNFLDAGPRYEFLNLVEGVQEIRDEFNNNLNNKKNLSQYNESLLNFNKELSSKKEELELKTKELDSINQEFRELEEEFSKVSVEIKKARETDINIKNENKEYLSILENLKLNQNREKEYLLSIEKDSKSIEEKNIELDKIKTWFEKSITYQPIIENFNSILSNVRNLSQSKKNIDSFSESLKISNDLLEIKTRQLEEKQLEEKELNNILPTEVIELRKKLLPFQPCPVCGSLEHPFDNITSHSLDEKTLISKKEGIKSEINSIEKEINAIKTKIIELKTRIEENTNSFNENNSRVSTQLSVIENWTLDNIEEKLNIFKAQWDKKVSEKDSVNKEITELNLRASNSKQGLLEIQNTLKDIERNEEIKKLYLNTLKEERKKILEGRDADEIENEFKKNIEEKKKTLEGLNKGKEDINNKISRIQGNINQISSNIEISNNIIESTNSNILLFLGSREDNLKFSDLEKLMENSPAWIKDERDKLDSIRNIRNSSIEILKERKNLVEEHRKSDKKPMENEDERDLSTLFEEKTKEKTDGANILSDISLKINTNDENIKTQEKILKEKDIKDRIYTNWAKLNKLFGSAQGDKFKVIAQGYTLDLLLDYSNYHLSSLSSRYVLQRVSEGSLALEVIDKDMLEEVRSVHSLSGGESFLISLALALGLSSLSSNQMRIESLFIDEGFGSLDADTLRIAMDTLEHLQTSQGRKIGVISHVGEMTERISTQIKVIKDRNGRSRIEIV